MKYPLLIVLFMFAASSVAAQTNYFPPNGSAGIGTITPSSYFHGGNNKVLEIFNDGTTINSQSHIVLSTGSVLDKSSAGSITWISRNSTGVKGMGYIGALLEGETAEMNAAARLLFATSNGIKVIPRMVIDKDGRVGIGNLSPTATLDVAGNIRAGEIKVEAGSWPDYVFEKNYPLLSLSKVEAHIKSFGHLPGIPSAKEVKSEGLDLGVMNAKLLQKIEELTLHMIELEKKSQRQQVDINRLKRKSVNKRPTSKCCKI